MNRIKTQKKRGRERPPIRGKERKKCAFEVKICNVLAEEICKKTTRTQAKKKESINKLIKKEKYRAHIHHIQG